MKTIQGLDGHSSLAQRREFINAVHATNVVFLPSQNRQELQLIQMRAASLGNRVQVCQEETEEGEPLAPMSRTVNLQAKRKVVHLDPTMIQSLRFFPVGDKGTTVAAIDSQDLEFSSPATEAADLLRNPAGIPIDNVLVPRQKNSDKIRLRRQSLFLTEKRVRAADLKEALTAALPSAELSFAGPAGSRGIRVDGPGGEVDINRENQSEMIITVNGVNANFYAVRKTIYEKYQVI